MIAIQKKIIFIGGTSRSGSTLLDLILGNNAKSMSLGEIQSIVHPTKKNHFIIKEKLLKNKIWGRILREKKSKFYINIFNAYPDIDIFIDSSKDPFWIEYFNKTMSGKCTIKNILIYKKPHELASSFIKRGLEKNWITSYKNYHRKYNTLIDDYFSIYLGDLLRDDAVIEQTCKRLGVPYHEGIKDYVGNNRVLFYGSETPNKKKSEYHSKTETSASNVPASSTPILNDIVFLLENKNICNSGYDFNNQNLKYNNFYMAALRLKTIFVHTYAKAKHLSSNI